jgi:hypothetical protein
VAFSVPVMPAETGILFSLGASQKIKIHRRDAEKHGKKKPESAEEAESADNETGEVGRMISILTSDSDFLLPCPAGISRANALLRATASAQFAPLPGGIVIGIGRFLARPDVFGDVA